MIGILSSTNNPFLCFFLESLCANTQNFCLLLDTRSLPEKDIEIIHCRTSGYFKKHDQKLTASALQHIYGIDVFTVPHTSSGIMKLQTRLGIKLLLNIGTPRKLENRLIDLCTYGVINIHPGYLPVYRGCSAVEWALIEGNSVVNTIHFMNSEYDSGPIIAHCPVSISPKDDYYKIRIKVHLNCISLAGQVAKHYELGIINKYKSFKQEVTSWPPRKPITDEQLSHLIKHCSQGINLLKPFDSDLIESSFFPNILDLDK